MYNNASIDRKIIDLSGFAIEACATQLKLSPETVVANIGFYISLSQANDEQLTWIEFLNTVISFSTYSVDFF